MDEIIYKTILALHIISVIFWLAALFYLPRLFVYHAESEPESAQWKQFSLMESRLANFIATPSMLATWFFGLILIGQIGWSFGWLWIKLVLVLALSGYHGACIAWHKKFLLGNPPHSSRFFRKINEVPPILTILIVFFVILKPF